jgi:Xaa-Pro aminopeptidase
MCFSIEPGLYKEGVFGVRLENSCYFKDGKIHSFVKMNYEDKLIDYNLLTEQEKEWLEDFEVK